MTRPKNHEASTEYERLVQTIYQKLLKNEGQETIEVKHNEDLMGKSGVAHQIDVFWRFKQAGIEHLVAVECKNYASTVELGDVRNFKTVIDDIGASRGLIVTKVGFQSGARDFAKSQGIDIKLARKPTDEDWAGLIREVQINISLKSFDRSKPPSLKLNVPKSAASLVESASIPGNPVNSVFVDAEGVPVSEPLGKWLDQNVPILQRDPGGPYESTIQTPGKFIQMKRADGTDVRVPVESVVVIYHVSEYRTQVKVSGDDGVEAVLRDFQTGDVEYFQRKKN